MESLHQFVRNASRNSSPHEVLSNVSSLTSNTGRISRFAAETGNRRCRLHCTINGMVQESCDLCSGSQARGTAQNSSDAGKRHKSAGTRTFSETVGEFEQSSGNVGERPETHTAGLPGLLSPLYPSCGGSPRAFVCGLCFRVTRTQIGGLRHLRSKHGFRFQMDLFGSSLAAGAE